jgi:4-hydroxybutyrate dehydrogenase/sulfolactaldehyde 3-reductase
MERIGFIGLGRMGKPMASNLRRKGFELVVLDVNPKPIADLVAVGAEAGTSVAEIARRCNIVVTMLPSSVEVEAVALGPDGIFANAARGSLLLDMSTIDPLATDRLHAAAGKAGLSLVDAPVGRLAEHADRAESLFMVGASDADFQRVKPLLDAMGTTTYHCGGVGSGQRTKLVNNYVAITLCQVNAEALALSQRFGLDIVKTLEVLYGTSASNGQLRMNFPNKVLAGDTTPGFTIDLAHKDLSLVLAAAHAAKVPMPVAAAVR